MYSPIPRNEIADAIAHVSALHRRRRPSNEREARAHERREAVTRILQSNLIRTKEHPTLKTLLEVADVFSLTIEGAHRLFGYDISLIREHDLVLNGGRTHIVEANGFERDRLIDLPLTLAPEEMFRSNRMLRDLVLGWQREVPLRILDEVVWHQPGTFYVHVGTEDSLGSSLPPGALALIEPIDKNEENRPDPRRIYLLQFAHGYSCSRCVVTRNTLVLLHSERAYNGLHHLAYPGAVRIAGRVRAFALGLPLPVYPALHSLPTRGKGADLVLPWEHRTRDRLFATGYQRFERSKQEGHRVREFLEAQLQAKISTRTERRYRYPSSSHPHVNALISLTLTHFARYTDSLTTSGVRLSDTGRFSLQSLLKVQQLADLVETKATSPTPSLVWENRRKEFVEWPRLLSMRFPQLRLWEDRVLRLAATHSVKNLEPKIASGSWVLLEDIPNIPDVSKERDKRGWSRPIYVLRRGLDAICGHLERDGERYLLLGDEKGDAAQCTFREEELPQLSRVAGIAVPV